MPKSKSAPPKSAGKSIDDFRAAHDKSYIIPKRIREGLAKLGDGWEYEIGFLKLISVSTTDLAAYRDEFEDYIVIVGGHNQKRIWAGTKELAAKMREMV